MPKPKVLVVMPPDHYALRNLEPVRDAAEFMIGSTAEFAREHAASAEILMYSGFGGQMVPFAEVWPQATSVKWVHSLSAGVEKYMIPSFIESPVPLTNARGVFKHSLAEFAILGVLFFSKRVRRLIDNQQEHYWDDFKVDLLSGKVFAVVGYGEIGRECAMLAKALGMKIHAVRRNPHHSSTDPIVDRVFATGELKEMLSGADAVVAAAPLTTETRHMLSDPEFAAMKKTAIVINVGRGPVIDEAALIRALQKDVIRGAALDVFEHEPLPSDSPLWDMKNVLLSPHCTDRTENPDWLDLTTQFFVANLKRYIQGQPLENVVDKKAGY